MKEMHLLPSPTFKVNSSVALSKSVTSAAVIVLQPITKVKQKLRGASEHRRVTETVGPQLGWAV